MPGALDGIRVLDLSTLVQGPQAAAYLYNLGAEVIKVELPEIGDVGRHVDILPGYGGFSSVYIACNRGKRSVAIDLRTEGGRIAFLRLVETADVIVSNFKPGTMEGWSLGYDDLSAVNPRIIWAAGSYLGPVGPDAEREGADMVGQAAGGIISTSGYDGDAASPVGTLVADHCGAQNLVVGVVSALYARERTGRGQKIETSLLGGQIWLQSMEYTHAALTGNRVNRTNGGHPLVDALYGVFPTADGFIAMAGCPDHLWPKLVECVEHPELADNPRFGKYFTTPEIKAELRAAFEPIFRERTTAEWNERLARYEQRFAPVRGHGEVLADPQPYANNYLVKVDHPEWGEVSMVGSPIAMSDTPTRWGTEVQELGQETEMVLLEAGFTWDDIEDLRQRGAF